MDQKLLPYVGFIDFLGRRWGRGEGGEVKNERERERERDGVGEGEGQVNRQRKRIPKLFKFH